MNTKDSNARVTLGPAAVSPAEHPAPIMAASEKYDAAYDREFVATLQDADKRGGADGRRSAVDILRGSKTRREQRLDRALAKAVATLGAELH